MKKLVSFIMAFTLVLSMAACGKESGSQDSGKETVECKRFFKILTKVWETIPKKTNLPSQEEIITT